MKVFILLLIGLLSETIQTVCTDLSMFAGEKKIYPPNLTCNQYDSNNCSSGPAGFPDNLNEGRPVSEPGDFKVNEYDSKIIDNGTEHYSTGINITWTAPRDNRSVIETKGYFLKVQLQGASGFNCWLFAINLSSLAVNMTGIYRVELYALPPVDPEALTTKTTVNVTANKRPGRKIARFKPGGAAKSRPGTVTGLRVVSGDRPLKVDLVILPFVSVLFVLGVFHWLDRYREAKESEVTAPLAQSAA